MNKGTDIDPALAAMPALAALTDYAFDFAVRLDDLIIGCMDGGNPPEQLQYVLQNAINDLEPGGSLHSEGR